MGSHVVMVNNEGKIVGRIVTTNNTST